MNQDKNKLEEGGNGLFRISKVTLVTVLTLAFAALNATMFLLRDKLYFRDPAIIFDGALRILNGQAIYSDFGAPLGPMSFWLPAFFMNMFGKTWFHFSASQLIQSLVILFLAQGILFQLKQKTITLIAGISLLSLCFLLPLSTPWYNLTASLFLLASFSSVLTQTKSGAFLAGICCAACLLSKQDFGGLALGLSLFLTAVLNYWDAKMLVEILVRLTIVIGATLISFASIFVFVEFSEFAEWYFTGASAFRGRIGPLVLYNFIANPLFALTVISGWLAFRKKDKPLLFASAVLLCASVTLQTSSTSHHHHYFVFVLPVIFAYVVLHHAPKPNSDHNAVGVAAVVFLCWLALAPTIKPIYYIIENLLSSAIEHPEFNKDLMFNGDQIIDLGDCSKHLKTAFGPSEYCGLQADINELIKSPDSDKPIRVLNLSEYPALALVPNVIQPKGMPLWFDPQVTISDQTRLEIKQLVERKSIDLVLFQANHVKDSTGFIDWLEGLLMANGYIVMEKSYTSPSNLSGCGYRDESRCRIMLFSGT